MNSTCLITKLKGTVDNSSLSKFGYLNLICRIEETSNLTLQANKSLDFKIIGADASVVSHTFSDSSNIFTLSPGNYTLFIEGKYDYISEINCNVFKGNGYGIYMNLKDLSFCKKLIKVNNIYVQGSAEGFEPNPTISDVFIGNRNGEINPGTTLASIDKLCDMFPNIMDFRMWRCFPTGNLSTIASKLASTLTAFINFDDADYSKVYLTGELKSLAPCTKLKLLSVLSGKVNGSIEEFVESSVKTYNVAPKTLKIDARIPQFTLNSQLVGILGSSNLHIIFSANDVVVKNNNTNTVLATYNVQNDSWTY